MKKLPLLLVAMMLIGLSGAAFSDEVKLKAPIPEAIDIDFGISGDEMGSGYD